MDFDVWSYKLCWPKLKPNGFDDHNCLWYYTHGMEKRKVKLLCQVSVSVRAVVTKWYAGSSSFIPGAMSEHVLTWKYHFLVTCSSLQLTKRSLKSQFPLTRWFICISNIFSLHVNKEKKTGTFAINYTKPHISTVVWSPVLTLLMCIVEQPRTPFYAVTGWIASHGKTFASTIL